MKKFLKDFIPQDFICEVCGNFEQFIEEIENNSKKIKKDNILFVAMSGVFTDGENFISEAIENGAKCILVSENFFWEKYKNEKITFIKIFNLQKNIGTIISNFYDNPTDKLKIIAVTGTCGKTSVAFLGQQLFNLLGVKCGLISTIHIDDGKNITKAEMTTPGIFVLQKYFYEMVQNDLEFCFIEVSSHAMDQDRLNGTKIFGAIFTNISNNEHLDYHKTFENYLEAKKKLFTNLDKNSFALFNADDLKGNFMVEDCCAKKFSFGVKTKSNFDCLFENKIDGLEISFDKKNYLKTKLFSISNAYNLLAVYAVSNICKISEEEKIQSVFQNLDPVLGRFQFFKFKGINIIVDYAHKARAVESILENIKSFCKKKIITVFGCGGNRDTSKRPIMTELACKYSNAVVITSDNIRTEDFKNIVFEMVSNLEEINFRKTSIIFNRKNAIHFAVKNAEEGDFVVILGKGHENYQIIDDKVFKLSDLDIVKNLIKNA